MVRAAARSALLDVDDFEQINDRHGHPHGEAVLMRVASPPRARRTGSLLERVGSIICP